MPIRQNRPKPACFNASAVYPFQLRQEDFSIGCDRPKAAHEEFPGVSMMPRSMWEPWLVRRAYPPRHVVLRGRGRFGLPLALVKRNFPSMLDFLRRSRAGAVHGLSGAQSPIRAAIF